jgi:hypothetical protein
MAFMPGVMPGLVPGIRRRCSNGYARHDGTAFAVQ